jgi:DNA gyrase/topoisomerase IV subunit A
VVDSDDIVIVTSGGKAIRQHASEIRVAGRNTQGVRLIKLQEGDVVADVAAVVADESEIAGIAPPAEVSPPPPEKPSVEKAPAKTLSDLFSPPVKEAPARTRKAKGKDRPGTPKPRKGGKPTERPVKKRRRR